MSMSPTETPHVLLSVSAQLRNLNMVALALMVSGVVYAGVLLFVNQGEPQPEAVAPLFLPLTAAALGSGMASVVLPRILSSQVAPTSSAPSDELRVAVTRYFSRTIIAMAMAESVILLGFVLAFVGQQATLIAPFLFAGETLMLYHFPRLSRVEAGLSEPARALLQQQARG